MLIFHRNSPVIQGTLLKYYEAKEFKGGRDGRNRFEGSMLDACLTAVCLVIVSVMLSACAFFLTHDKPRVRRTVPVIAPATDGNYQSSPSPIAPNAPPIGSVGRSKSRRNSQQRRSSYGR